jgi:hypothetical protein
MVLLSSRIIGLSSCFVCERFMYTHFSSSRGEKSGTIRSGEGTGHGIADIWKCCSSPNSTLCASPIICDWTGFEMAWHYLFSVCRLCFLPALVGQKSVLKCNSWLCSTLYNLRNFIWEFRDTSKQSNLLTETVHLFVALYDVVQGSVNDGTTVTYK